MENNTKTTTAASASEGDEGNVEFVDLEHEQSREECYDDDGQDDNASTMSCPESNGPNYGALVEAMKELTATLDEMYEQVFKLELDMAELTMQSAFLYEPSAIQCPEFEKLMDDQIC